MNRYFLFLFAAAALSACAGKKPPEANASLHTGTPVMKKLPYPAFLDSVAQYRKQLKDKPAAAERYLYRLMDDGIPAYWTGTPWDFNGTTRTPGSGTIACGYFVTNVLSDLGFPIQRVRLAQQASSVMIGALTTDIARVGSLQALEAYLGARQPYTVFIVGLDFHTGFIIKTGRECYFLHANYIGRQGVIKEKLGSAAALAASKSFMIGELTANKPLLAKWISNK